MIGGIDGVEDLDLYIPHEAASESETVFSSKSNIHNAILVLPPHAKQALVDCLRKKGIVFHASGKRDSPNNWLINCFEWLLGTKIAPRRYLASGSPEKKAPSPAPKKTPAPLRSPFKQNGKGSPPAKPRGKGGASSPPSDNSMSMTKIILISVASAVILVVVVLPVCCCCIRRRKRRKVGPRYVRPKDDRPLLYISSAGIYAIL